MSRLRRQLAGGIGIRSPAFLLGCALILQLSACVTFRQVPVEEVTIDPPTRLRLTLHTGEQQWIFQPRVQADTLSGFAMTDGESPSVRGQVICSGSGSERTCVDERISLSVALSAVKTLEAETGAGGAVSALGWVAVTTGLIIATIAFAQWEP